MTNFVFSGNSSAPQTLNANETGMILPSGALGASNAAAVTMTGQASLTVLGTLYSDGGAFGIPTVAVSGNANRVLLGERGYLGNTKGPAISVAAGSFSLSNSGQIEASAEGVLASGTSVEIANSGSIRASGFSAINVSSDSFHLVNSGEIVTLGGGTSVQLVSCYFDILNTGTLGGITALLTPGGTVTNLGTILGSVFLGGGANRFDGAQGVVTGVLDGQQGDDWLATGAGRDHIIGGVGNDTISSGADADTVSGGAGNDVIAGGTGNDRLVGDEGNDSFMGDAGSDTIIGGTGRDMVDYRGSSAGVEVDLTEAEAFGGDAEGDSLTGVEGLRGSAYGDVLVGDGLANLLRGAAGADRIDGGAGNDTLRGDTGADTLEGGTGFDTVTYAGATRGVVVNLFTGAVQGGQAQGDVLSGFEAVVGSEARDQLTGDWRANLLNGGGEGDVLTGGLGNDTLIGGRGAAGDSFIFNPNDGTDQISDFERGRDVIDISAYGFASFAEIMALTTISEDGKDTVIDFTDNGIDARIVFKSCIFLNETEFQDAVLWQ
ncbi:calcium-binding protein [Stagnihabitans tardus]|uniref:Calcium-binding protein n=1 Tax=Stagnihabitans tardus TaxID=2699202 RepID=A0AAE4Y7Z1_9RHOB|nr:calcium-binding protein [Stagnihabitans tardus]NBZ87627.1 hypothetical protein [Stagnihabitans tardus]